MKILFAFALMSLSILAVSCTCHDETSGDHVGKEGNEPGKVPPSPDIPEPPRNTGAPKN